MPILDTANRNGWTWSAAWDVAGPNYIDDPNAMALIANNFNCISPENAAKQAVVWQGPTSFDFSRAKTIVQWGRDRGKKIRANCVMWDNSQAGFFRSNPGAYNRTSAIALAKGYMTEFAKVVGDNVGVDLVNEAIADNQQSDSNPDGNGLRQQYYDYAPANWRNRIGADYPEQMFILGNQIFPKTTPLGLNDFNIEYADHEYKWGAFYNCLKRILNTSGARIDFAGFQLHLSWDRPVDKAVLRARLKQVQALKLKIQVSELSCGDPDGTHRAQCAQVTSDALSVFAEFPEFTVLQSWEVTDALTYLRTDRPWPRAENNPWDDQYKPKPMLAAIESVMAASPRGATPVPTPTPEPTPMPTPSPDGLTMLAVPTQASPATSLVDANGTWTVGAVVDTRGRALLLNGTVLAGTAFSEAVAEKGKVYHRNAQEFKWYWLVNGTWNETTTDPRPVPVPTPTPGHDFKPDLVAARAALAAQRDSTVTLLAAQNADLVAIDKALAS